VREPGFLAPGHRPVQVRGRSRSRAFRLAQRAICCAASEDV